MVTGPRVLPIMALALVAASASSAAAAALTFVGEVKDGSAGVNGLGQATALVVSPDGKNVYATSEGDDAIVGFSRNPASGALVFDEMLKDGTSGAAGIHGAAGVAVSPDGKNVYVAGADDDAIAILDRNAAGAITYAGLVRNGVGGVSGLANVHGVAVSPDGAHVYAAAVDDNAVAVFARDGSGGLSFVETQVDGANGVDGLNQATAVAVSQDGHNVYALGNADDAIAVFSRDATTGKLTFVERIKNGQNGVGGLNGPTALALSADGFFVYVTGGNADSVDVFARSPATGALTFLEQDVNGKDSVDGLDLPLGVAVSPDGGYVYVAASSGRSVAVFIRNQATGLLTFLERDENGDGNTDGLIGADGVAPSPDGQFVYTSALTSSALAIFQVTAGITTTTTTLPKKGTTTTTLPHCGTKPRTDCHGPVLPHAGIFSLRDGFPDARDRLTWRWRKGAATSVADFGDPRVNTGYRLCVFEPRGNEQRLIVDARAPAGGRCGANRCWHRLGIHGFRYDDPQGTPDGLRSITLRAGGNGQAAITVVGKGRRLGMPLLPLTPRVIVQLRAGSGQCWEADYSAPVANDVIRFRSRAD